MCWKCCRTRYRLSNIKEVKVIHNKTISLSMITNDQRPEGLIFHIKTGLEVKFKGFILAIATEDAEDFAPRLQHVCSLFLHLRIDALLIWYQYMSLYFSLSIIP